MDIRQFEAAMEMIVDRLDIKYSTTPQDSYDTLPRITDYFVRHGELKIWEGGSDNTIFSKPEYNWMFRAWHDHHHIKHQLAFTPEGEALVCMKQINDVLRWVDTPSLQVYMIMLLNAEINGQVEVFTSTGQFVKDQKAFTKQYVEREYGVLINL